MGFFGKNSSTQTSKLKSLMKHAVKRLDVVRRPRLGRRSFAHGDVGKLLSIGHLDRALLCAEQVIDEDNMLEVLKTIELYCKILIEQAAQLEKPKECSEELKKAAAGLIFASARCGELPELLDARAILADKFGPDFSRAAKDGSHGVVEPMLVRKLTGERASTEQKRTLAKKIAAENDILLDFPENPRETHLQAQGKQRHVDDNLKPSSLGQLSVEEKVTRESKKYLDARMAAEAAFESASFAARVSPSFAAMAAREAVKLSRSEFQGKGSRGGGYDEVHPVQKTKPSWKPLKSSSPSPSWSDRGTVSSVGSEAAQKGKGIVFDQSDEEEDEVVQDVIWTSRLRGPPYRRTASTMGIGGGGTWHEVAGKLALDAANPQTQEGEAQTQIQDSEEYELIEITDPQKARLKIMKRFTRLKMKARSTK